jgi:hypothetical protein
MDRQRSRSEQIPSQPFRAEREGPGAKRREGEVGSCGRSGGRSAFPHLTPALSAPRGREGDRLRTP